MQGAPQARKGGKGGVTSSAASSTRPVSTRTAAPSSTSSRPLQPPPTAEQAFRHFFKQLNTKDIEAQEGYNSSASSSSSVSSAPPLAVECYLQLHSALPALHAHHLDALQQWLTEQFHQGVLPTHLDQNTPFEVSVQLLEAVRSQARMPPVHSKRQRGGQAVSPSAEQPEEEQEEPSFAEALAVEAGQAKQSLSRRRGAGGAASASSSSTPVTGQGQGQEVHANLTTPLDGRLYAAASLYAVLLVHSLPLLLPNNTPAQSTPSSTGSATPAHFLRLIPLSLAAEARAREAEKARHLSEAVVFDVPDLPPEEEAMADDASYDSDHSDYQFEADPLPPDSDKEDGSDGSGQGGWGTLDSIPVDPRDIEQQVQQGPGVPPPIDWYEMECKILQLVSLWDADIFNMGDLFEQRQLAEHLFSFWTKATRHQTPLFQPRDKDVSAPRNQLRMAMLQLCLAQMVAHPQGTAISRLLSTCVQSLLELPQLVPGMGDGGASLEETPAVQPSLQSNIEQIDTEATLLSLLSQLCSTCTPHPFPSNPATASLASPAAPASSSSSSLGVSGVSHLHNFISFNLPWLSRRLAQCRHSWDELLASGRSLRVELGGRVRSLSSKLHSLCNVLSFYVWSHRDLKASASLSASTSKQDVGAALIESGVVTHLLAMALADKHDICHSHQQQGTAVCEQCAAFEVARSHSTVQVDMAVDEAGQVSCFIRPYASPLVSPTSDASSFPATSLQLPVTSSLPNPLSLVHHLLLLLSTFSPAVSRHLLAHPSFLPFVSCSCYEELYPLPSLLLPLWLAVQTRGLSTEQALAAPVAPSVNKQSPAAAGSIQSHPPAGKSKKKSKLVVSALPTPAEEVSTASAAEDELSWDAAARNLAVLQAALQRSVQVMQQLLAHLPSSTNDSPTDDVSPVSSTPAFSVALQLLQHMVYELYLFSATSPAHKLLLAQLTRFDVSASTGAVWHVDRVSEGGLVSQLLSFLRTLRSQLPSLSRSLIQQLQHIASPTTSSAVSPLWQAEENDSEELQRRAAAGEPMPAASQRQAKQQLEWSQKGVQRLQHWLKLLLMEVAKKD